MREERQVVYQKRNQHKYPKDRGEGLRCTSGGSFALFYQKESYSYRTVRTQLAWYFQPCTLLVTKAPGDCNVIHGCPHSKDRGTASKNPPFPIFPQKESDYVTTTHGIKKLSECFCLLAACFKSQDIIWFPCYLK